jgi:hypothetical protein
MHWSRTERGLNQDSPTSPVEKLRVPRGQPVGCTIHQRLQLRHRELPQAKRQAQVLEKERRHSATKDPARQLHLLGLASDGVEGELGQVSA